VYRVEGGRLTVEQKAKTVSGEMTGLTMRTLGTPADEPGLATRSLRKRAVQPVSEEQIIKELEDQLRLKPSPQAGETGKGTPGSNTSSSHAAGPGLSQPAETTSEPACPKCGAGFSPGDNFCERCGQKLK
jgi:hypothetical protein